jgi:aldose 1-epimerase
MPKSLLLSDGVAQATIRPELGAGLASYDLATGKGFEPLFRRAPPETMEPFALASNLLVPWSNRISGGGFCFEGRFHSLSANLPGELSPIHGNGFSSRWQVEQCTSRTATLTLASEGPPPYRYRAIVDYALNEGALAVGLSVTNEAECSLPFGLGLHPWLPRTIETTLLAPAELVWLEDERHLPIGSDRISKWPVMDFALKRALPDGWINNGFSQWSRKATVTWRDRRFALDIEASAPANTYVLYSPGAKADFFCFEPVTHPVDAHNLPGGPKANGLTILANGETLAILVAFSPRKF